MLLKKRKNNNNNIRWRVGDGASIRVWEDPWLPSNTSPFVKSPMADHNSNIKVADLFNQGKTSWEDNLLVNLFNQQEVNLIKSIPISDTKCGDKIIWVEEEKGDFTVKSCYGNL